jgi:ferredoxin-type protein NapH
MMSAPRPGGDAVAVKGWWRAQKWLFSILGLFLLGPWAGIWIVKGNLNFSRTLDVLPLTDPLVALQSLAAGHLPESSALIGALIVAGVYFLMGRLYCSWVCPVNVVTDAAGWLRGRLGTQRGWQPRQHIRLWMLAMTLAVSAITGTVAWEFVNPVSVVVAVFLFDLFVSRRGWCGHVCPVGAFYGLLGAKSVLRVSARGRDRCDDCMDCYAVCPEPHVITPALKGAERGLGPVILGRDCTNCGRCIDVCPRNVYAFATRFGGKGEASPALSAARAESKEAA